MPDNVSIELEIDPAKLLEVEKLLADVPRGAPKAISTAINKTLRRVRTMEAREIREELNLKYSDVLARFRIEHSTVAKLAGSVTASRKAVPMIKYGAKQTAAGVRVIVRRSRGVETIKSAFIATMASGHTGVFRRAPDAKHRRVIKNGKSRSTALPIKEVYGPTVVGVLANKPGMLKSIADQANAMFVKAIDSQTQWLLAKAAAN